MRKKGTVRGTNRPKSRAKARIRSMTGFGRGLIKGPYGIITAEIKTLNHKHLSVSCAPFEDFFLLEERIKSVLAKKIVRGKVFVKIVRDSTAARKPLKEIRINEDAVEGYVKKIKGIQKRLSLKGDIVIQDLLRFPGVIEQGAGEGEERMWPQIRKATEEALQGLLRYRENEGAALAKDFDKRLKRIRRALRDIRKYEKQSVEAYRARLGQMTRDATKKKETDRARLEEEVALFARNCDIAEERTRLENHVDACERVLRTAEADAGKKLDFIAQEMHREVNTIGAKASDYRISNAVIELKSEIEKIREQLKNVE